MQEFRPKNPNYKEVIEDKLSRQYFMKHIGFELTNIEPGLVEGVLLLQQIHKQQNEVLHGGVTATLSDIVAGFAAFSLVKEHQHVVTADIRISYFKPGIGKSIYAKGTVVKPGSRFHFCESEVYSVSDKGARLLIAKSSSTMAVLDSFV